MKWTGKDANAEANFNSQATASTQAAPVEEKKETAKPAEKVAAPVKKAAPAKKEPSKVQKWKTWEVSNYGAETVHFKAEEVQTGMTFNFFNCEKTKIIIEGKCKNIMF